jgi:hypothetical protein
MPRHLEGSILTALSFSIAFIGCDGDDGGDGPDPADTGAIADAAKDAGAGDTGTLDGGEADTGAGDTGSAGDGGPDAAPGDTGGGDAAPGDAGPDSGISGVGVVFRAFDLQGAPLEGAVVGVAGQSHTIGPEGEAFIPGLAGDQVFTVSRPGFTTTSFAFDVPASQRVQIDTNLHPTGALTAIDDAVMSQFMEGAITGVVIPDSIETSAGADVTGTFEARLQVVELTSFDETLAAPFPFIGIDASGQETPIAAFGVFEVALLQGGDLLRPKAGQSVPMSVGVPMAFADLVQPNDVVPKWRYDETRGRWIEDGDGTVVTGGFGTDVWTGFFDHFSWWMIGVPFSPACMNVAVEGGGVPLDGALVRSIGLTYGYAGGGFTGASGSACLPLRPSSMTALRATHASYASMAAPIDVMTGAVPSSCGGGACGQAGIELLAPACASGLVLDETGSPYDDALVLVEHTNACGQPVSSHARTDAAGAYCALGPQGADVTVRAKDPTSTDSEDVILFSAESTCANCPPLRDLLLGDVGTCIHGLAQENRGAMPPAQAAMGTPIYVYSSDVLPSCQAGMDQPAMWGTLVATGMVGVQGMFCLSNLPVGTAFLILGDCSTWLSDQCGPSQVVFNLDTRSVCGQPSCVDAGTIEYYSACGG